jgi:hypothetical protein
MFPWSAALEQSSAAHRNNLDQRVSQTRSAGYRRLRFSFFLDERHAVRVDTRSKLRSLRELGLVAQLVRARA